MLQPKRLPYWGEVEEMGKTWVLLVSPAATQSGQWEAETFDTKEQVEEAIGNRDITKDHFYTTAEELARILDMVWSQQEEKNGLSNT